MSSKSGSEKFSGKHSLLTRFIKKVAGVELGKSFKLIISVNLSIILVPLASDFRERLIESASFVIRVLSILKRSLEKTSP